MNSAQRGVVFICGFVAGFFSWCISMHTHVRVNFFEDNTAGFGFLCYAFWKQLEPMRSIYSLPERPAKHLLFLRYHDFSTLPIVCVQRAHVHEIGTHTHAAKKGATHFPPKNRFPAVES